MNRQTNNQNSLKDHQEPDKHGNIIPRYKTLEERAAEYGGKLLLDGEYDFGERVGREKWD